jgi:D-alanyl-D-alanine carboxypeptidase
MQRTRSTTFLTGSALVLAVLGLAAVVWAQVKVSQNSGWTPVDWTIDPSDPVSQALQSGLDRETTANPQIPGQIVHIIAPAVGLDASFVSGADILPSDEVRLASNIKPFMAAAILKLVEQGRFELDDPMAPLLSPRARAIFEKAGRKIDQITIRQLLNHSSGIDDYGNSRLFQLLAYVPTAFGFARAWSASDQMWFSAAMTPAHPPGAGFSYSDTNYLLLADINATALGIPNIGAALRKSLNWSNIGANDTYWEGYEPAPVGTRRVRQCRGGIEDTNLNFSFDQHGGGGLVMSMSGLARAHKAIVRGDVFADSTAMTAQMRQTGSAIGSGDYGLGLFKIMIEGETCYAHGGRWGSFALYCPTIDLAIARSWGQSNANPDMTDAHGLAAGLVRYIHAKNDRGSK